MFNWLKNLFSKSDSNSVEQESHNYFYLEYSTSLCGIGETFVFKTTKSVGYVEDNWSEFANEHALDFINDVDDLDDLEIYTEIREISEEEYLKLKSEDYLEDWAI